MGALKEKLQSILQTKQEKIVAENIKKGVTIFDIEGSLEELKGQEKTVTPSKVQQDVTPDEEYNGMTKVTVEGVTSSIDENITPENIKKGISILDVEGTMEEGIDTTSETPVTAEDMAEGKEAWVNGEKVVGNVRTLNTGTQSGLSGSQSIFYNSYDSHGHHALQIRTNINKDTLLKKGSMPTVDPKASDVANALNLTADKIMKGQTVLDIEGTGETDITTIQEYTDSLELCKQILGEEV